MRVSDGERAAGGGGGRGRGYRAQPGEEAGRHGRHSGRAAQQRRRDEAVGARQQRRRRQPQPLQLRLLQALRLGPAVLEPDLDLRLGQLERGGELRALRDGEVLLLTELLLERGQLLLREWSPRLAIGLVLAEGADLDRAARRLQSEV